MLPWEHSEPPPSSFAIYTEGGSVAIQSSMAAGKGAKRERYTEPSLPPLFSMPASLAYCYYTTVSEQAASLNKPKSFG